MTGIAKREDVLIFRTPIIPTDLSFQFKTVQFHLYAVFVMTTNKALRQTLKETCVSSGNNCFPHGQVK